MKYQLTIERRVVKVLSRIPLVSRKKIISIIESLRNNPFPNGVKKLTAREGWRVRVGDYRIIYEMDKNKKEIFIIDIGHRKEIYR